MLTYVLLTYFTYLFTAYLLYFTYLIYFYTVLTLISYVHVLLYSFASPVHYL